MEALQDWPEPIVRVQALSDSGLTAIPLCYVRPPALRPSNSADFGEDQQLSIPIIDLAAWLVEGAAAECRATTIAAIADACREWGFFQVVNHGVSPDLVAKIREVWRRFFDLPMEEKQIYANHPKDYEGYGSRLGVEKGDFLDWGDYFYLRLHPPATKNPSKWPTAPNSCRETVEEYGKEVMELVERLMKAISVGLGLEAEKLWKTIGGEEAAAAMRVNYYPKCPQPELTLGLSPHSDPGVMTVLLADDRVEGLQVRKGDAWVTVQPIAGAFIVNLSDQLQVMSNGKYKSVEHRVVANGRKERFSLAVFCNPKNDLPVGPVAELVTPERPPLYQAMTYDEYRRYIRTKGLKGKAHVDSLIYKLDQ